MSKRQRVPSWKSSVGTRHVIKEYRHALKTAAMDELQTALAILKEFPRINGASRKLILEKIDRMTAGRRCLQ